MAKVRSLEFACLTSQIVSQRSRLRLCVSSVRGPQALLGDGFAPATENLYRAGNPLVQDIVTHWGEWRDGVPRR
ncbi:purine nucleoside permease [Burkholderia sp. BCC0322]|uniref:purine nucleoside permease n=1 Tax=Burkholderia sp. BCC0322 TaxID=2676296 RepID=UPI001FC7DBEE|nr:purine nucleoside permease [Burkholderia sp. BCC0322]